jgi:polysaccharide biosynthesis/export protein
MSILALGACGNLQPHSQTIGGLSAGPTPVSGIAALNRRVLSLASAPSALESAPLGPGDLIRVSVFEVPELSDLTFRIPMDGTVRLPLVGAFVAAARTPAELEDEIRGRLLDMKYMHDPRVTVFVSEQKSHQIAIIGAVRKGGVHSLIGRLRVADALAMAEGLTDDADHVIHLIRRSRADEETVITIDMEALTDATQQLNPPLQAGDIIHVPRAGFYYIGGEVVRPGMLQLRGRTTLDQAIVAAGGINPVAAASDIRIYRTGVEEAQEVLTFDLDEIEAKRQAAPTIQKRDLILVGKSKVKAVTYGIIDFFRGIFHVGAATGL